MAVRRAVVAWAAALAVSCGLLALPLVALAATFAVNIQGFAYSPTPISIRVGDTVTWTNRDGAQHSARFAGMGTPILSQGQSGSLTFTTAGSFNYDCAVHGSAMQGTVIVQAATPGPTPQPTPPPTPAPTAVRTAPATAAPTAPPTAAPTETPSAFPTTPAPSASASPTTPAPLETAAAATSPSPAAAQLTAAPAPSGSPPGPLLIGAAALAIVALGAMAFLLARRS
jgi:plastocyanin